MRQLILLVAQIAGLGCSVANAKVRTEVIEYKAGGVNAKGLLAWDDEAQGKRPGVLVIHEWWGLNDYAKGRAIQLAEQGYLAFCADMYGDGKVAAHPMEAREFATIVRQNVGEWQKRATAALDTLKSQDLCDGEHLAAIGYCFGGSTALQLAYTGADLDAVVTFHAALPAASTEDAKKVKASIVVCHGANDTFIPAEAIDAFRAALDGAKVDYEFIAYSNTVHSFTVPDADSHNIPGMSYNKVVDARSWKRMLDLFNEKFGRANE